MLRASDYNIYIPTKNENDEYLLLHGYSGACDVVSEDIYRNLYPAKENKTGIDLLLDADRKYLIERGYITKKSSNEEQELLKKIVEIMMVKLRKGKMSLTLVPTYNCNFRCSYCFEKGNFSSGNELLNKTMDKKTVDTIFTVLDNVEKEGPGVNEDIVLFGGEPLMKENYEIVKYIVEKGAAQGHTFTAITNGYDLEFFQDLLGSKKIHKLQITLDGSEEYHNKRRFLRGGGETFAKIIENINKTLSQDIHISLRANIDKSNVNEIEKLIELFNTKKWTEKENFSYYFKSIHACDAKEDEDNRFRDKDIMKKLASLEDVGTLEKKYNLNSMYSLMNRFFQSVFHKKTKAINKPVFCSSPINLVTLDPYHDIYPCWEMIGNESAVIGKLENEVLSYNDYAEYWKNRNVGTIEECSRCAYALICSGNCPAHAKRNNDELYSAYCSDFKKIINEVVLELHKTYEKTLK